MLIVHRIVKHNTITIKKQILILLVLWISACANQPPNRPQNPKKHDYSTLQQYLPELVKHTMKEKNITGLSIAVVDDQQVIYNKGFGYAKKSNNEMVTPDTVFCVASVSKLFTGMAIMQLVEQGKVDLDKPVKTYLSDFAIQSRFKDAQEITVRHLLTHHSGLPSDRIKGYFFKDFVGDNAATINHDDSFYALASSLKNDYVATKPNTIFSYSNIGYALLGDIISRVSGMPFEEYIQQNLLSPMHMNNSAFKLVDVNKDLLSLGYINGKEVGVPVIRDIPAGQLMSTVNDLSLFMEMIFANGRQNQNTVLSKSSLDEMFRIQNSEIQKDAHFRIGLTFWGLPKDSSLPDVRWHGGDLPPYYATLVTLPNTKLGIVVLANSGKEGSLDLMEIALPALELAYEIKTGQKLIKPLPSSPVEVNNQDLKKYEGQYAMTMGLIDVKAKNSELELKLMGKTLQAVPQSDGSFSPYYNLMGFIPLHPDELKKISIAFDMIDNKPRLKLKRSGISAMGSLTKVEPPFIHTSWLSRVGEYELINPDQEEGYTPKAFKYDEKHGYFYFILEMAKERYGGERIIFPIKTLSDSEAVTLGEGRALGESLFVMRESDDEIIYYSGYKLKKKVKP